MTMADGQQDVAGRQAGAGYDRGTVPSGCNMRILDWVESQSRVTRIWLDELIADGDPDDMVSVIHRQAAWLDLMRERLKKAS